MNFMAQMIVKEWRLEPKERWMSKVAAIDEHPVQTFGVHYLEMKIADKQGTTVTPTERVIAANITGYELILGKPWLKRYNPIIDWEHHSWAYNPKGRYARQSAQEQAARERRTLQQRKATPDTIAAQTRKNHKRAVMARCHYRGLEQCDRW
ncbi:MAG: hypothetical protein M1816_004800, partial [Peltula sp. TS41687]